MSGRVLTGDTWVALAILDYLVERKELVEVTDSMVAGQHRIFRRPHIG